MTTDFESRVLECIPEESELLLIEPMQNPRGLIELDDGRLLSTNIQGASTSSDGGKTWSETQPLRDANGDVIPGRMLYLQRLKSGAIGGFVIPKRDARDPLYGYDIAFSRSEDEGETWTTPVRASEPYNNTVMHGATITHTGRIVASVYTLIGKTLRQPSRVLFGDDLARVGAHGWEHFFTYCFALISDDEGATWRTNEGKGKWGGGGELFVTLDFSAGGHWRANEPVVAEVSPDHLLMVLRTPLGRFFQSWSSDNGTTWSHPEPTALAAALTPASLERIPGTDDLLLIWNQASPDEIERGLQRHRLSTAISKDGGTTWLRGRNLFSVYGEADLRFVEPPPIANYRAMELAPRLPVNDIQGTYPFVTFWKDRAIVRFHCIERSHNIVGKPGEVVRELPDPLRLGRQTDTYISLPISWFYQDLSHFG